MVFYLIGLGLGDAKDVTVRGLEIIKSSKRVFLEAYTSILTIGKEKLEEFYEKPIIIADRDMVEQDANTLFRDADTESISFLVVGDPFGATTHSDLILRAQEKNITVKVIHNTSILNAVGCCGLQLYNFGETVSIVFWTEDWKPDSFCDKISSNLNRGLHTLCLLDIKVKEQSIKNLMKGNKIYEPPRYMSVNQACSQLLEMIKNRKSDEKECGFDEETMCVGLARIGSDNQKIAAGNMKELLKYDFGPPLHSLIIVGKTHPLEIEYLKQFYVGSVL